MPEMPNTREDDLVGVADVRGGADPGDSVPAFFDRVDETADIARDVVEEVDGGHFCCGGERWWLVVGWRIGMEGSKGVDFTCRWVEVRYVR